ncbi:MAG TPA: beta-ketoacyl-[acyl-carrier-protein] synthase family protein [Planctomycetota bacterium]|nr:beta-ketoacyl-[acyl-carrier-protein] synthase family protein [Planctomycetota bacterium]
MSLVNSQSNPVVITGLGAVSPHGRGVKALWNGLIEGRSAFSPLTLFDASMFRNPLAGMVSGYESEPNGQPRSLRMLLDAAREALRDAFALGDGTPNAGTGVISPLAGDGCIAVKFSGDEAIKHGAIVTGTNFGGMSAAETALIDGAKDASQASLEKYLCGNAGDELARRFGIRGPRMNLSLSCASGTAAIAQAFDLVRRGRADFVLACGYDELSLYVYAGLSALRAITPETIRPFDKRRKGTLFSEGAGAMVIESAAHAARRKAPRVYAKILGRALNNDAYHMTAPETEAHGIKALMRDALKDAQVEPNQIDHINLHATGTPYNDGIETKAVHAIFGARGKEIPVCSVKSSIGHTMGAAGILESIAAVRTINEGLVPPVLGLDPAEKDPECNLNAPTGAPLKGEFKTVLKTSYGFGGTNAAVVLAKNS